MPADEVERFFAVGIERQRHDVDARHHHLVHLGLGEREDSAQQERLVSRHLRLRRDAILARMRPESGRAVREVLNWWLDPFMTTSAGAGPLKAPCLVLAGEGDVVHPPATVRQTAQRIGGQYLQLPGMSHWLLGEPGWEEVAEIALGWLEAAEAAA